MKRTRLLNSVVLFFASMLLAGGATAAEIALFYDPAYVDTSDSPTYGEAYNVKTALENKGHNVTPLNFDFELSSVDPLTVDILYIPELDVAALSGDIGVADYVNLGGCLIINGGSGSGLAERSYSFLNDTFGFSLARRGSGDSSGSTSHISSDASSTDFHGGPAALSIGTGYPVSHSLKTSSLPAGSLSVYTNNATTQVAIMPYGNGQIIYLSYDWHEAVPNGTVDGGWDNVLDRAVTQSGSSVGSADLSVSLSSYPASPKAGDYIFYTMWVTNLGPDIAQTVTTTNFYPASDMVYHSGSNSHGGCFGSGGEVLCDFSPLASGEVAIVTMQFAIAGSGEVTNTVVAVSSTSDADPSNNTASSIVTVASGAGNQADLQVMASAETNESEIGEWVWFSGTVSNAGPDGALNTILSSEVLAPGLKGGVHSIPDYFEFQFSNGVWYCDIGPLPAGATITMNTLANRTDPGMVSNVYRVVSSSSDPVQGNNEDVAYYTAVAPPTDLRISVEPSLIVAQVGQAVSYLVTVTNAGPNEATDVVVTNDLPSNVSFTGASSSEGSCTNIGNLVICNLGTMESGDSVSITIDSIAASVGIEQNQAVVGSAVEDTNPNNNMDSDVLEVVPVTDLQLSLMQTTLNPVAAGQHVNYQVSVQNIGAYTATGVVISNRLPENAVFISGTPSQGNCSHVGDWLECDIGSIGSGGSVIVDVEVATVVDGSITNSASVTSTTIDPDPNNNSATNLMGVIHADTDNDGIADWWELEHFASLGSMTTNSDSDGNGVSDVDEWTARSNPTNPVSHFVIPDIGQDASGRFIVYWDSFPGREYDILWTSNLVAGFELLTNGLIYPQNSYTDTVHDAESVGIYKIRVRHMNADPEYTLSYGVNQLLISAGNEGATVIFMEAPARSNVVFTIRDGQTLSFPSFHPYSFTDIANFGHQTHSGSSSRRIVVDGVEQTSSMPLSLSLQPGWINMGAAGPFVWEINYGADRKQLSISILPSGGSGTHTGAISATATFNEVADLPVPIIRGVPVIVHSSNGLILDGTLSYDPDSTGHIDYYEWDLDYDEIDSDLDGYGFDVGPAGPYLELSQAQLQSMYTSGQSYTIALRVIDSNGGLSQATVTFTYVDP